MEREEINEKDVKKELDSVYDGLDSVPYKEVLKELGCAEKKTPYYSEKAAICVREAIIRRIKEFFPQESFLEELKNILDKLFEKNFLVFYEIIKKNKEIEKLVDLVNSFKEADEYMLNSILSYYYKIEKLFKKYTDLIIKYVVRYSDKNILYKIEDIRNINKIGREIEKISIKSLGKRQLDRLVKLAYMLDILYDYSIEVQIDPDKNLYDNYLLLKNIIKKYIIEEELGNSRNILNKNEKEIDIILPWFKHAPNLLKKAIQKNIEKFGSEKTYVIDNYEVSLKPKDLISQILSLQMYQSCISPGRENFKYSKIYLENPYTFFGIIKKNDKIIGRFLVFIGYSKNKKLSIMRISKVYGDKDLYKSKKKEKMYNDLEKIVERALKLYAKENNLKYLEEGKICVPSLIDAYGDYIVEKEKIKKNQESFLCVYVFGKNFYQTTKIFSYDSSPI